MKAVPTARAWRERGRDINVLGRRVFMIDEGPRDAPAIVVLHGFPSASFDFWKVLPELAAHWRVILHDHVGFGYSSKPVGYSYSIVEQADTALSLWQLLGVRVAHVLAHDYGCSVATELMMRRKLGASPVAFASMTLVNSGLYYDMADLRVAQHLLRMPLTRPLATLLGGGTMYKINMRRLFATRPPELEAELDLLWEMTSADDGRRALGDLSHYLEERRWIYRERWDAAIRSFDPPSHVLWGDLDPVGVPAIARKLSSELPRARLTWLQGVGHYPMLEAPERFVAAAAGFFRANAG